MERFLIREGASDKQNQNENKEDKKIVKSTGNKRKYVEDYLKYGFIPSVNDPSLPFCLICQKTLSNETMVPSKLLRHIETNHREQMNNPISYFENIRSSFQKQSKKFKKFMTTSDEAQTASYMIAQLIARKKKAHAKAEEIILPALKIVAGCMLTNDAMAKVTKIPLSSKTIARRIEDMSEDIELQIKQSFNDSSTKWAIQLDETTDISNKAQLLAFLRFVDTGKIVNNYFFCKELKQRTTGADIFELVDENVMKYNLRWENCVSVCTDGAPAMKGSRKGLIAHVIKKNPNIKFVHCMIHREMLVSKSVPPILVTTLDEVVKVVNYIKSNALRSRIFSTFCEAMDSDYKNLLFHTEVRWLSKGKVLNRFISMKNEIMAFIDNEEINFPFMMSDVWWLRVSFLGDIFDKLNSLNLNLQGAQENIITISTKLKVFKEKLSLWNLNIAKENFASFPMVQENPSKSIIKKEVEETLTLLSASFDKYFPYLDVEKMEWVVNPFMHCEIQHLEEEMQENLIDLKNDLVFKRLFTEKELSEFWLCLNSKFPKLSNAAIESLLPFGSSYLCEQGFSTLTEMKSKKRERLQMIDEEMRVCLSQSERQGLQPVQGFRGDRVEIGDSSIEFVQRVNQMVETRERIKAEESAKPQTGATIGGDASSDPVVLNPNIDIPKYDGTEDPRPWIESLEEIGFLYHWADYIISRYAAMNMIGSAKTWLNLHKVSFTSWENFKSRLIEDFASDANKEEMRMRLNRIQQWNEPAIRFAEDILVLCNKVDPQMEEETKINWVIGGLKKEYSFALHLNPPKNTNELLEICKKLDLFEKNYQERAEKSKALYNGPRSPRPHHQEQWKNATSFRRPYQNTSKPQAPTPRYYQNKPLPQVSAPRRSYTPNPEPKPVYPSKTYNKNPNSNRNRTEDGRPICFKCNKPGHVARYCRVRFVRIVEEDPIVTQDKVEEEIRMDNGTQKSRPLLYSDVSNSPYASIPTRNRYAALEDLN
ncbi:hypothetical protein LAZ67_4003837 [Cordylochernes scorpioides]|uniref:CCHC-type domain-containing protein n=1 Tax=Cordylochernes scorpioides TaxID=51811 RepID=A0ABY6KFV7_9ARAC|nr:hypothetical protein LAZ67_4003837 [Cordylochernes scorpioides]